MFLAASDVNVDFDISFLAQMALFGAFIILLKPLVFDPLLRLYEERERRTDGARKQARTMDEKAAEVVRRYEDAMDAIRADAGREREQLRAETVKLEARILEEARQESARIIEEGRKNIEAEMQKLRGELEAVRPALAAQIASKILGREVRS